MQSTNTDQKFQLSESPLDQNLSPQSRNQQIRDLFRQAFDQLGGAAWLVQFATKSDANARVFVQAISKLLPSTPNRGEDGRERIIIDIPWLTKERLSYKRAEEVTDVPEVLE